MDGLKITEDKLPQTIKDLLPPEIIDRSNFGKIMDVGKFSELSNTRKELVDKLYIKYIGRSFGELNQLPVNVRDEYLDKLNYDIDKIQEALNNKINFNLIAGDLLQGILQRLQRPLDISF